MKEGGTMLKNQIHPAAIRSKNLIVEGLLGLMNEMHYDDITITMITEKALLTRRTFYAHFKTKHDVLDYRLNDLNTLLFSKLADLMPASHQELALTFFNFWSDHVDLLMSLSKHNLMPLVVDSFEHQIREIRQAFGCKLSGEYKQYGDYSSAYFTGVLSKMLEEWISNDAKESPEELVNLLAMITQSFSAKFSALDVF